MHYIRLTKKKSRKGGRENRKRNPPVPTDWLQKLSNTSFIFSFSSVSSAILHCFVTARTQISQILSTAVSLISVLLLYYFCLLFLFFVCCFLYHRFVGKLYHVLCRRSHILFSLLYSFPICLFGPVYKDWTQIPVLKARILLWCWQLLMRHMPSA